MPTVLCYGDSNTWGYVPGSFGERYPRDVRWPGRLAAALGGEWEVIAEGLNGRTATLDSPVAEGRNGLAYLAPCLYSHAPLDVVVIFLGTNDVSDRYCLSAGDVAAAVGRLVRVVKTSETGPASSAPRILVVCPPPFASDDPEGGLTGAAAKTRRLGHWFREVCTALECELLDLDGIAAYSPVDGHHLDPEGHGAVARAVEERIRALVP
jgi:lysophospholipase L1-like esterase